MRLTIHALGLALLAVAGVAVAGEKADREKLQGTWKIVAANTGYAERDRHALGLTMKVVGDTIISYNKAGEPESVFSFRLDPAKTPKQIDLTETKDGRQRTVYGIYALENGKLRTCGSAKVGGIRPSDFTTVGTINEFRIYVWEKQKER